MNALIGTVMGFFRGFKNADAAGPKANPAEGSSQAHQLPPDEASVNQGREEGIPWIWVCGGALVTILLMIVCLFGIIFAQGISALWPKEILELQTPAGPLAGIPFRFVEGESKENAVTKTMSAAERLMIFAGNQDFSQQEFAYIEIEGLKTARKVPQIWFIERLEWGPFLGFIESIGVRTQNSGGTGGTGGTGNTGVTNEGLVENPSDARLQQEISAAAQRRKAAQAFEHKEITPLNREIEELRIERRGVVRKIQNGLLPTDTPELAELEAKLTALTDLHTQKSTELQAMREDAQASVIRLKSLSGIVKEFPTSQIVRGFQPNELDTRGKLGIFFSRLWEFVSQEPREANTAGGIFPAIFGTVAMTLLMTIAVMPVGVLTALYIREIARQGFLVSLVRVAVGNLAGVPSIVYGVFGLGFFCYTLGSSIDQLLFVDKLPNATFGTGGILWASLTLALLTVPVVIVSTEEALSSVPRTLREASYGCGATRLQTLLHIVLPKAMPGILTGLILAMARGVGEVAPLLMTGVVKLAPELPIDTVFPYVHLERSFMHLGFHIYDLGFQSRSAEASRPMVFASTCLLVGIVLTLNFAAIKIRSRLRKRFEGRGAF